MLVVVVYVSQKCPNKNLLFFFEFKMKRHFQEKTIWSNLQNYNLQF